MTQQFNETTIRNNELLNFGTSKQFGLKYNSTSTKMELVDSAGNVLLSIEDGGAYPKLVFPNFTSMKLPGYVNIGGTAMLDGLIGSLSGALLVSGSGNNGFILEDTSEAIDEKVYTFLINGGNFTIGVAPDTNPTANITGVINITRTADTADLIQLAPSQGVQIFAPALSMANDDSAIYIGDTNQFTITHDATAGTLEIIGDGVGAGGYIEVDNTNDNVHIGDLIVDGTLTATLGTNSVATASIQDDAVTYAKIQNVTATDKLLGRSTAGAGIVEEIACTSFGRSLIDDADASAGRTTLGFVDGTWTPTGTGVANVASQATHYGIYQRVGNTVTFSGRITVTPTAGTTLTDLRLSLPVASNFTAATNCFGTATLYSTTGQVAGIIYSNSATDDLTLRFYSVNNSAHTWYITGSYRVL